MIVRADETSFNALEGPRKLIVHEHSRRFAFLDMGHQHGRLGLSWRSDGIEPVARCSPDAALIWVGVDQRVAAVDARGGYARVLLVLEGSFLDVQFCFGRALVLTDTEAILFNPDCSIRKTVHLPDLPEKVVVAETGTCVELASGEVIAID